MPTTPTITRQRTRPGLRLVEAAGFPACLVVARPHHGDREVLVVVDQETPAQMLRELAGPSSLLTSGGCCRGS